AEGFFKKKFGVMSDEYTKIMNRLYRKRDLSSPLSEFLGVVVMVIVMYFGGKLILGTTKELETTTFFAFIAIFSQLIPPAKAFSEAYTNVQRGLASAERVNTILDAEITIADKENPKPITSFN